MLHGPTLSHPVGQQKIDHLGPQFCERAPRLAQLLAGSMMQAQRSSSSRKPPQILCDPCATACQRLWVPASVLHEDLQDLLGSGPGSGILRDAVIEQLADRRGRLVIRMYRFIGCSRVHTSHLTTPKRKMSAAVVTCACPAPPQS